MARKKPFVACWVRGHGPSGKDLVEVFVYGPTRRADEGIVGHDLKVRPTRLGPGPYTAVVSPDAIEPCPRKPLGSRRRRR